MVWEHLRAWFSPRPMAEAFIESERTTVLLTEGQFLRHDGRWYCRVQA